MFEFNIFNIYPPEFKDPVVYFIPGFLILIGIELYVNHRENRRLFELKDSMASIGMGLGSLVINIGIKFLAFIVYDAIYQHRIFTEIGFQWWAWIIILFADDFSFYMHHRLSHKIRILWAAHINHHSSENYNLAVALRQSWAELFYKYIFWLWLPLIGFHPVMIMTMMSLSLIYQFWLHTQIVGKLGFWEWFLNTPSHHRVHHGTNILYLDRNHAGILIIWDRMFGTFEEEEEKPVYGITKNIHTYNLIKIATHEFLDLWKDMKKTNSMLEKIKYMLMPPGWSHDGSSKTADELRKEFKTIV